MSGKWPGGFINKTAPTVVGPTDGEGGSASGIWTLDQVADYESRGLWPMGTLDRRLYAWGQNTYGQVGDGTTTTRNSPVQVGALTTWLNIACGYAMTIATKTDGTLWSWGYNNYGQLGTNNTTNYSSPVQVGALTNWAQSAAGQDHSIVTTTDGKLYSFGHNYNGQLGLGNTTNYSSPVQVGALTNWSKPACGLSHCIVVKTDGTIWAWGRGSNPFGGGGQLGQGNTSNYSSPVQIGGLTNWSKPACGDYFSLATTTDGKLYAWGYNGLGQLGQGNTTNYSSPVQVGALTTWADVSAGNLHTLAVKTDGTLWTWGLNNYGQLGLSNYTTPINSPVQVGALTTWSKPSGLRTASGVLKTDGTLWGMGWNGYGELGTSNTTTYNSPVQVGALTTWSVIAQGPGRYYQAATTKG